MAQFTDTSGNAISALNLVIGQRRVRFDGGRGAPPPTITSSASSIVSAGSAIRFDVPRGIYTIDLRARATGTATITGTLSTGQTASITVTVRARMALPARNTTEGMVARLLLSETMSPSNTSYNAADARTGMEWMIVVLNNRLRSPRDFGASGASTIEDIIRAPGQFAGFESYPRYSATIVQRIQTIIDNANDNNHSQQTAFQNHLTLAITIAHAHGNPITDPAAPDELVGWRTSGHGSPCAACTAHSTPLLGNQFFKRPR